MENQTSHPGSGTPPQYGQTIVPQNLPNANLILILGILSIVFCWWHFISLVGIVLAVISLVLARREITVYEAQPSRYTLSSFNNVKTGRVCAIIGLTVSVIVFVFVILLVIGILATLPFWGMMH